MPNSCDSGAAVAAINSSLCCSRLQNLKSTLHRGLNYGLGGVASVAAPGGRFANYSHGWLPPELAVVIYSASRWRASARITAVAVCDALETFTSYNIITSWKHHLTLARDIAVVDWISGVFRHAESRWFRKSRPMSNTHRKTK